MEASPISNSELIYAKAEQVAGRPSLLNPVSRTGRLVVLLNINSDTGAIACGEMHLKDQGGSWSDGKWYKTFDLVLKTSHTGVTGSRYTYSPNDLGSVKEYSPNDLGSVNEAVLSKGLMERLSKLKKLLDAGLINKSDYEKKKNEILNDL